MQEQTYIQRLSDRVKGRLPAEGASDGGVAAEGTEAARPINGRYELGAPVGRGRVGEIFEALDLADGDLGAERRKAVQLLAPTAVSDAGFAQRLARAYEALRTGGHPNLVKILDVGRDGQRHYLVMELLAGVSLRAVLDDARVLPLDEALPVVSAVGNALVYLHAKGFVHGNVRPEQVFVTFDYEVKLLDLVPLPPREARPEVSDDVYDLACLAYTLLTGRHPYNACSAREARRAGLGLAPIASLPAAKWAALERGLALSPENRIASVTGLMVELGLDGTERLRAGTELHAGSELRAVPEPPAERAPAPEPLPPPIIRPEWVAHNQLRARGTGRHALRLIILLAVAVVLTAATFLDHDRLRSTTADLFTLAAPRVEEAWSRLSVPSPERRESVAGTLPAPEALGESPVATSIVESAPIDLESEPVVVAPPQPVAGAEVAAAPPVDPAPAVSEPTVPSGAGEAAAELRFAASVVTVSESDPAARVVLERLGAASSPETVVWWTTAGTAVADQDYADLGERTETLVPGEVERALFVPLIQDAVPESTETFFVHLGRYDQTRRHLGLLSSVRVEIRAH
jgi:hypothetical protein